MLKQIFDENNLRKIITRQDIYKYCSQFKDKNQEIDKLIDNIVENWNKNLKIHSLNSKLINSKHVFFSSNVEDSLKIRLLDRFIRRIYKVRQSDRNNIIKQIITILSDKTASFEILRIDIHKCYESINFENIINDLENDLILAPECIELLRNINNYIRDKYKINGLPRGLPISSTLAELYLEKIDKKIKLSPNVIYMSRYVDDIFLFIAPSQKEYVEKEIRDLLKHMDLDFNTTSGKYYSGKADSATFDYLGYSINTFSSLQVTISKSKINKIKTYITRSFIDYKYNQDIKLLKRRIEYVSMLKAIKKGSNGKLFAGIAYNYQFVTDQFDCIKSIDDHLQYQIKHLGNRYHMSAK